MTRSLISLLMVLESNIASTSDKNEAYKLLDYYLTNCLIDKATYSIIRLYIDNIEE